MAEIVQSLFGVSPEMYQQQQEDRASAQALQFARLTPMQQANYAIGRGAYGLAGAIGGALGGTDPELQRRTVSQQILGMIDPNRPETFDQAVQMALQSGDQRLAYGLRLEAEKFKQQALVRSDEAQIRADRLFARQQEAQAQRIAEGAYRPGTPERAPMLDVQESEQMADQGTPMPENIAAVAPSFDISRVAPELMRTAAGRAQLEALTKSQKSLKPETVTVKEGDTIYSVPTTPGGAYTPILSGGEKPTPFTGEMANAALVLYKTNDPAKIFKEFGQEGLNAVSKKAEAAKLANAPKINIDVRDPTAVAKASLDTMNKWEGYLKASGDIELANRYSNLQSSIELARNGNPSADGASLYNLAKIYDPSGAVQEGDKKSILGNASIPEKVKLLAQQFYAGGTFTPTQRNNILIIAKEIRDQRNTQLERYRKEYVNVITKFGGSAESIFNPYSINQKPANLSAIITAPASKKE